MDRYRVIVRQMLVQYKEIEVEALNEIMACGLAESKASELDFWEWGDIACNEFEADRVERIGQNEVK